MFNFKAREFRENFDKIVNHSQKYTSGIEDKNCLVLVHPFYCKLDHDYIDNIAYEEYFENLKLIEKPKKNLSVVLFEDPTHYIKKTSKLAERGIFDKVIFSKRSSGSPDSVEDLKYFKDKKIYLGGMYNGLCVSRFISEVRNNSSAEEIIPIKELILNSKEMTRRQEDFSPKAVCYNHDFLPYLEYLYPMPFREFYSKFF